jgi:hypothetical protein
MGKSKFKKDPENMGDLYSNTLRKKMFLSRALNAVLEHPDYKNLSIPREEDDERWEDFVSEIRGIASTARHARGITNEMPDDIPTMYSGMDIPLLFNPVTAAFADDED